MNYRKFFWMTSIIVFLIDRITKTIVVKTLFGKSVEILPFFSLTFVGNRGIVFGIGSSYRSSFTFILASLLAIAVVLILYRRLKADDKIAHVSLGMIFGGGLGNLFDRLFYGYVIDFIDLHIGNYHWPAFNVADTFIVIGVLLFLSSWKGG
ncbi:MAG: signal peptidase II [Thermosulfidibacteraceae bacterium]